MFRNAALHGVGAQLREGPLEKITFEETKLPHDGETIVKDPVRVE